MIPTIAIGIATHTALTCLIVGIEKSGVVVVTGSAAETDEDEVSLSLM